MIEFIDNNDIKRTCVDGNNQYLTEGVGIFPPHGETWHLADTWNLDLAAKLIATGWPNLDIEADRLDAKLAICKRSDDAKGRLRAYSYFVELATVAIKDGILRDNDSPDAWLDWAQSKHYKIDHLTKYLGRSLSDKDAAFFAGIDAMLEPYLKPIDYGQAAPDAVDTTSNVNDQPPGKMPRTAIGKLAIKAAWQIECETNQKALVNAVITRLRQWVAQEDELLESIPDGVRWQTKNCKAKDFDSVACGKALERWHMSRTQADTKTLEGY